MNEIANTATEQGISVLDGLAMQARALRLSINVNMWQLARVFLEAKELVQHGQWKEWLEENADVSVRTAEDMIASYKRFGGRAPFEALSPSQTFKLLPLPAGTEDQFMADHDVPNMTTREIQEAVKQVRAEAQQRIEEAERRVKELEEREPEIPQALTDELREKREESYRQQAEIERISNTAKETMAEAIRLRHDKLQLERDLQDQEALLQEQQEALNRAQDELLNLQSAQARGEAERMPADELTLDVFSSAVREFVGLCARMPYMSGTFSIMDLKQRNRYNELLHTVEGWCEQSRRALESVRTDGGIVIE